MKKFLICVSLISGLLSGKVALAGSSLWQPVPLSQAPSTDVQVFHPLKYKVFTFNESWIKIQMFGLSVNPDEGMIVELPMPDGTFRSFKVWQSPMMHDEMAARYPEIKTFSAVATNDPRVTAKLDFTLYGFHAMIFDGENTCMIDPYDNFHDGFYMVHYKRDEYRDMSKRMKCEVKGHDEDGPAGESMDIAQKGLPKLAQRTAGGWNLRTYDLALSADSWYCAAATGMTTPTIAASFSKMTTSMNRINGVYEREFAVHMNFCAHEDTLIWPTHTGSKNGTDPFYSIDGSGTSCLGVNQTQCTNRIGSGNFDLGHVFTTGGGGISSLGVVCNTGSKGRSVTGSPTPVGDGYDIDYVAHEMGHEFGSEHTFNNNADGSCGGNAVNTTAYEPGSGATIMDYAGICSPDDLQMHSDPYFSASSLVQIYTKLTGSENACATATSTGNKLVSLATFSANYTIPYKTPFELTGPTAVDSVADTATTYCWAQWNLGDFGKQLVNTFKRGPIFRSYQPVYNPSRIFPKLSMVLNGTLSNAGVEGAEGEKVPDTARFLTFKMVVRDIMNGKGCFLFPDDTIHLDAVQTPTFKGFGVTSQNSTGISYNGATSQTITWDKAGTDVAPVSCSNVIIYMSTDGGHSWPYTVGTFPNTGTATINVPNPATTSTTVRFKVKGSGNVFFNINGKDITVTHNTGAPTSGSGVAQVNSLANETKLYPVPASETLHITTPANKQVTAIVYNVLGQSVWQGQFEGHSDISVTTWAKGVYHIQLLCAEDGDNTVKSFVIE